ncbi:MAG: 2,3-bisphosphoglycerate-independent phosphoglycerate mutase [Pseudomonadota bacterium]
MPLKPVVLCILDGWGLSDDPAGNAPKLANTPNFDRIWADGPRSTLKASGEDVGLPPGQIGNSEVGHTNIGAGRVVWMDLPKINNAIENGTFFSNEALALAMAQLKVTGGTAHIMGLLSPGGVHSHQKHIAMLATAFSSAGIPVAIHAFMDGRDVAPDSGRAAMEEFLVDIKDMPNTRVATVCGRFYAMDRDKRWDRVEKAFRLIADGEGEAFADPLAAIDAAYAAEIYDEFIEPANIADFAGIMDGDGLISANFRADRMREILGALLDPSFRDFDVSDRPQIKARLGMVSYSDRIDPWMPVMFPPDEIINTLGEWMAANGKTQLRLAETEKYPHVTFFLNGGVEDPDRGEDRYMAPSPKVRTYDMQPEMSAAEVSDQLAAGIRAGYDLIVVNFANPDMVGHTGDLDAAIAACEAVDTGLGHALAALDEVGGAMLVTADHGNCEVMIDPETGGPHTAHTTNLVPLVLVQSGDQALDCMLADGRLGDLAPTLLHLMDMDQPDEMTGRSLLRRPS